MCDRWFASLLTIGTFLLVGAIGCNPSAETPAATEATAQRQLERASSTPEPSITAGPTKAVQTGCDEFPTVSLRSHEQQQAGVSNGIDWHSADCAVTGHGFFDYTIPAEPLLLAADESALVVPSTPTTSFRAGAHRADLSEAEWLGDGRLRVPISARSGPAIELAADNDNGTLSLADLDRGQYLIFLNASWPEGGILFLFLVDIGFASK